ncbi:MAG: toxin C-terminal domain-containing protein [Bacteroidales bacterium]|nr:toxin C-terminal domain-containing protein [Bacteroidales bacterium]
MLQAPEGYRRIKQTSHGKPIYTNGKDFISPEADRHGGGVWKSSKKLKDLYKKETREGTYDEQFNRIKK